MRASRLIMTGPGALVLLSLSRFSLCFGENHQGEGEKVFSLLFLNQTVLIFPVQPPEAVIGKAKGFSGLFLVSCGV